MVNKWRLLILICGWMFLSILPIGMNVTAKEQYIIWLAIQNLWLIIVGYWTLRQAGPICQWRITDIAWGVGVGIALFIGINILNLAIISILSCIFGVDRIINVLAQEQAGINLLLEIKAGAWAWLTRGLIIIGAPIGEELLFRGALLTALNEKTTVKRAVLFSALCFAIAHFYVIQFIPVLVSGIILGWLYAVKRNILQPIAAHITVNTLAWLIYIL